MVLRILCAVLALSAAVSALATDQELDARLQVIKTEDRAFNGRVRDSLVRELRGEIRQRMASDSNVADAMSRLDRLEAILEESHRQGRKSLARMRQLGMRRDSTQLRLELARYTQRHPDQPLPSMDSLLALPVVAPPVEAPAEPAPDLAPPPPPPPPVPPAPAPDSPKVASPPPPTSAIDSPTRILSPHDSSTGRLGCSEASPTARFLTPDPRHPLVVRDSLLVVRARIFSSCGLHHVEIRGDSGALRMLDLPDRPTGVLSFEDRLAPGPTPGRLFLLACDTNMRCARDSVVLLAPPLIPPWIPWTSGGLVLLGLLTGLTILFRRPAATPEATARGVQYRAPLPASPGATKGDIHRILKSAIAAVEKEYPRGPRVVCRFSSSIPPIDIEEKEIESTFRQLVRLPMSRAGLRGTVLVATGRGPVNMEVVIEDNGPDLDEELIRTLFDPAMIKNKERQGMDKELSLAGAALAKAKGHLSSEARIDGGLRLRIRLPLPSTGTARTSSLLK
ncbi:MAG: hypothetical protein H6686_06120 [Fibrobacteria bacterium]|nr:hypothetical protein [Fibrobacteria bacterium]